ncbi:hypothetical protein K402DRAFT_398878 [Aulographum hederae CBS 113979]|uniref:Uncharacterized protein n=1 Tax=Aulographum hederae CBS 113979 TaxID=1176131 RepID=A0A6G1GJD3_9PEZI|nr:hypothetical protein K402DRAFT_398878 [Aulographum hederae CBS 113979]
MTYHNQNRRARSYHHRDFSYTDISPPLLPLPPLPPSPPTRRITQPPSPPSRYTTQPGSPPFRHTIQPPSPPFHHTSQASSHQTRQLIHSPPLPAGIHEARAAITTALSKIRPHRLHHTPTLSITTRAIARMPELQRIELGIVGLHEIWDVDDDQERRAARLEDACDALWMLMWSGLEGAGAEIEEAEVMWNMHIIRGIKTMEEGRVQAAEVEAQVEAEANEGRRRRSRSVAYERAAEERTRRSRSHVPGRRV